MQPPIAVLYIEISTYMDLSGSLFAPPPDMVHRPLNAGPCPTRRRWAQTAAVVATMLALCAGVVAAQDTAQVAGRDTSRAGRARKHKPSTLPAVEVRGTPGAPPRPLVDHTNAATGGALDSLELRTLPTDGRDPLALVFSVPGVAQATGFFDTAPILSIDGQNSLYTQYYLDGLDTTKGFWAAHGSICRSTRCRRSMCSPTPMAPRMGRSSNGIVNFTTRSGMDEWHGNAVEGHPRPQLQCAPCTSTPGHQ